MGIEHNVYVDAMKKRGGHLFHIPYSSHRYSRELKEYTKNMKPRKVQDSGSESSVETFSSMSVKCTNINVFAVTEQKGMNLMLDDTVFEVYNL